MTKKPERGTPPPPELAFDPLEAALRQLFDDVAAEAVPDDFMQLVAKLENKQPAPKPSR
jgi:Anti-sigma factor NepR